MRTERSREVLLFVFIRIILNDILVIALSIRRGNQMLPPIVAICKSPMVFFSAQQQKMGDKFGRSNKMLTFSLAFNSIARAEATETKGYASNSPESERYGAP